jgi:hypothetical protein
MIFVIINYAHTHIGLPLMTCEDGRNAARETALVSMARDLAPADMKAVLTGIGGALRTHYSDVLRQEIPDRIAELLKQLDQQLKQLEQQKHADPR